MKKFLFLFGCSVCIMNFIAAQNVGIGTITPTEKLHVDSGNIKIGKLVWSGVNIPFLKFGDGEYVTLGEEEADDKLTIRAKELFIRPSTGYTTVPISIQGTNNFSHFYFGANEDTYIRGGKNGSNVNIGDIGGGRVGIGMSNPTRAMLEQNGAVGTTAAIFGGEGAGISLQRNWPVVGFNHYYNGGQKSMASGWAGYLALNQTDGSLSFDSFGDYISTGPNQDMGTPTTQFSISRKGNAFFNGNVFIRDFSGGAPALTVRTRYVTLGASNMGIRFEREINGGANIYPWNIWGEGAFYFAYNGTWVSNISSADGAYFYISDIRMKKDIANIQNNTLKKIMALRPVNYLMKKEADGSKNHIGFISQEVEKIYPEVVQETNGIKTMNYTGLIPILTKGIQEQQQQIETLQRDNADIKKELQELKRLILSKN
jgi:hypothetical protein